MKNIAYLIVVILVTTLFFACDKEDSFSTSSSLRLDFSNDTIRFDTVFTTIGTATKRFKVYNNNSDALKISTIELMSPDNSGFRMNVDGQSGNKISDIDLLGKDSLYIFIEVTLDLLDQNNPLLISDSIRFQFNGVTQYIRLEAIGQDVIIWRGKTIEKDTTLTAEKPFLIYESLNIKKGAILNIEKGVRLHFHDNAGLRIEGQINAVGTINEPIIFRGDRLDNLFESPKLPYDRIPGQWNGVTIASDSYENRFENVRIRNGVYGVFIEPSDTLQVKISFMNTMIQNATKGVLYSINSKIDARNSLFANSGEYTVKLIGGSYNFLHCTITNYMLYRGVEMKGILYLSNKDKGTDGKDYSSPLGTCQFINTIVSGKNKSKSDITLNETDNLAFNYHFMNCLLYLNGSDDEHFSDTVWNQNPSFKYIFNEDDTKKYFYDYNFDIKENSPARNKASRTYATELPDDIRGISRRSDEAPDIGCFEWKSN